MIYLTLEEIVALHAVVIARSGGDPNLRDAGALQSAAAQPAMTFGGAELYPTLARKAAALSFSLSKNHPFVDGNKRIAHAAMETFLVLNGHELDAGTDEQETVALSLAAGTISRDEYTEWVAQHVVPLRNAQPGEAES